MSNNDDRYRNPWAEWQHLAYQGVSEVPSAIAANFFTGYTNGPAKVLASFAGILYAQDDRHSAYTPNLQELPEPAPTPGNPVVSLIAPPEGTLSPTDIIHVRVTNTVANVGMILEVIYGDLDTGVSHVVHTGTQFRWNYNSQGSNKVDSGGPGAYQTDYYVERMDGWPEVRDPDTGELLPMWFNVYVYDSTGEAV